MKVPTRIAGVLALALGLATPTVSFAAPGAVVVFNEIQYNPLGQSEDGEWVELFNQQGIMVDLSGWRITGLGYTFPDGTFIDPGAYVVVAKTPAGGQLGPFTGSIDNGGERLRLYNQGDRLMDEIDFGDNTPWPPAADGSGATLAKLEPYTDNADPAHWERSEQVGGTPGAVNFPGVGAPPPTSTVPLVALADEWRYNESGNDLGAGWASSAHALGGDWAAGPGAWAQKAGQRSPSGRCFRSPRSTTRTSSPTTSSASSS